MDYNELKDYINNQEPTFLQDARHKGFVCPVCGNGQGKDGDGLTRKDGRYHCFKCGLHEDTVGLIGKAFSLDGFVDCLKKGAELYGVTLDRGTTSSSAPVKAPAQVKTPAPEEPEEDFTDQYRKWNQAINEEGNEGLMYLQGRGLSLETINRFNIGFVPDWKHPKTEHLDQVPKTPRVIIPTGPGTYLARDTRPADELTEEQRKYTKSKVGTGHKLYNVEALKNAHGNVFVVEGEIDALSIIEAGGQAVGLGSASNTRAFLEAVKRYDPHVTFTLLPDNDETGRATAKDLQEGLKELDKKAYIFNLFEDCKDANEYLVKKRDALTRKIRDVNVDPAFYEQYTNNRTSSLLQGLVNRMAEGVQATAVSTGFARLNELLDGGLYEDLYILMAGTGHGKTALTLQVADTIAKSGRRVLFYNLELSNEELIARSISRETFTIATADYKDETLALSARDVTDVSRFKTFSSKQKEVFREAVARYKEYCDNVVFHEALGYYDTEKIDAEMRYYVKKDGKAPVVMVDYLQMLSLGVALNNDRKNLTERQAVDKAILDLKAVSRNYKTTVFVLSSMNRTAQDEDSNKEITMSGAKESGGIEYTAGTVLSLDYARRPDFGKETSEREEAVQYPRKMRLFIHKNRYGVPKQDCFLDYYSRYNFFFPTQPTGSR